MQRFPCSSLGSSGKRAKHSFQPVLSLRKMTMVLAHGIAPTASGSGWWTKARRKSVAFDACFAALKT